MGNLITMGLGASGKVVNAVVDLDVTVDEINVDVTVDEIEVTVDVCD